MNYYKSFTFKGYVVSNFFCVHQAFWDFKMPGFSTLYLTGQKKSPSEDGTLNLIFTLRGENFNNISVKTPWKPPLIFFGKIWGLSNIYLSLPNLFMRGC